MRIPLATAMVLGLALAGPASAQVGHIVPSLEWLTAESDAVVIASVAGVRREPAKEGRVWMTVTLKVRETLKGDRAETLAFSQWALGSDQIYEGWREAGREPLWFLARDDVRADATPSGAVGEAARHTPGPIAVVRLSPPVEAERLFSPLPPPVLTMNLDGLDRPDAILGATRAAIAAEDPGRPRSYELWLPHAIMARSGTSGDFNRLIVPEDRRLEALARRLIASPGDFNRRPGRRPTPKDDEGRRAESWLRFEEDLLRAEGIRGLAPFRSAENIATVKARLDDPAWWHPREVGTGLPMVETRAHFVRAVAYATLRRWGVEVDRPTTVGRPPTSKDIDDETRNRPLDFPDREINP